MFYPDVSYSSAFAVSRFVLVISQSLVKMSEKNAEAQNSRNLSLLIKFFHLIAAIQFGFAVYYDFSYVHVPSKVLSSNRATFGGKFKYLTFIDGVRPQRACNAILTVK